MIPSKLCLLFSMCMHSIVVFCQQCEHTNLLKQYDILTSVSRFDNQNKLAKDSCRIEIRLREKVSRKIKFLSSIHPGYSNDLTLRMFDEDYVLCGNVRSYVTGLNVNLKVTDNDFGDIVVADVNFDGLEDIVIKKGWEGNAGPTYKFFLQQNDSTFSESGYLSNEVEFFPIKIDRQNKELITLVRANSVAEEKTVYKLNDKGQYEVHSKSILSHKSLKKN